jgi:hypothetical protein
VTLEEAVLRVAVVPKPLVLWRVDSALVFEKMSVV